MSGLDFKNRVCEFCLNSSSKYKCPKCLRYYCSVDCYKSENHLECSEKFYKDCIMETLKEEEEGDKTGMAEILRGMQEVDETMPNDNLEEIFASLNLGNESEELWSKMSQQDKGAFISMHSNKNFSALVPIWKPWWQQNVSKLVEEERQNSELRHHLPKLFTPPDLNTLISNKSLSRNIPFDIINLLYGYCYLCRLYNGDLDDLMFDSAEALLSISHSLTSQNFDSLSSSISHCILNLTKSLQAENYFISNQFSVAIIRDVVNILGGVNNFNRSLYIKAALSDCRRFLKKAWKTLRKESEQSRYQFDQQKLMKAFKKIEFYLSWMEKNGEEMKNFEKLMEILFHSKLTELNKKQGREELIEEYMERLKPKTERNIIEEL